MPAIKAIRRHIPEASLSLFLFNLWVTTSRDWLFIPESYLEHSLIKPPFSELSGWATGQLGLYFYAPANPWD